ncbi:4'-phosphopantetheinyl transferase [Kitasatospora sp. NPDC092948]|uniref:4'-phosphopantetheinyl transferase family protein n=1 Tax=Kitasatospora sp. NPDC092948 TaxID=3364088 RepID=UPI0038090264
MIERILPPGVVGVEYYGDPPGAEEELASEEAAAVRHAVEARRREFASVRWCARRALERLGASPCGIPPGRRGAPRWPPGVVGSMTHCVGFRAAAAACADTHRAIGIDAESLRPLPDGVLAAIALPEELRRLARLRSLVPEVPWDRLLFSMKESVYKAWYPRTGRFLDFDQADVDIDPAGSFRARLLVPTEEFGSPDLTGRWHTGSGLMVTAVALPVSHHVLPPMRRASSSATA